MGGILDPGIWAGAGAAALAFVGGRVSKRDARLSKLEQEVEECRERDARFVVIEAGFRMVVGEMARENPNSVALQMCGDLLNRKLGPPPTMGDVNDLLRQLDELPGAFEKPGGFHDDTSGPAAKP